MPGRNTRSMKLGRVGKMADIETIVDLADEHYEREEYNKAFELFMQAAEKGDPYGQYSIGFMYENGIGVEVSSKKSLEWYGKASELGYEPAQKRLANLQESQRRKKIKEAWQEQNSPQNMSTEKIKAQIKKLEADLDNMEPYSGDYWVGHSMRNTQSELWDLKKELSRRFEGAQND